MNECSTAISRGVLGATIPLTQGGNVLRMAPKALSFLAIACEAACICQTNVEYM
jgi:hypothetical protein